MKVKVRLAGNLFTLVVIGLVLSIARKRVYYKVKVKNIITRGYRILKPYIDRLGVIRIKVSSRVGNRVCTQFRLTRVIIIAYRIVRVASGYLSVLYR